VASFGHDRPAAVGEWSERYDAGRFWPCCAIAAMSAAMAGVYGGYALSGIVNLTRTGMSLRNFNSPIRQ
jgi:hypothetical protein